MKMTRKAFNILAVAAVAVYVILLFICSYLLWSRTLSVFISSLLMSALVVLGIALCALNIYIVAQRSSKKMVDAAYSDPVTGGINYTRFKMIVAELFERNPSKRYAIFYSDIKNFKYINDVYGFETGNKVLRHHSDMLRKSAQIAFARISADNFVSIEEYDTADALLLRSQERLETLSDISTIVPDMPAITLFVGIYCSNGNNNNIPLDAMIDRANIAQCQIKKTQLSGCLIYNENYRTTMIAEQEMENNMRAALANGEFVIYLQPKIDIHTGHIAAAEALVRWNSPTAGLLPPMSFIPLFERNGFIQKLDTYVFEQVCILIRRWLDMGSKLIPISANVSKMQLNNPTFLTEYIELKERYDIPDGYVEIEFTESMLFDNHARMIDVLTFFQSHGFLSSIDDFGSGYSSLNLLKNLPTDFLKLDKVFFDANEYQNRERVIIKNVILMAKELSMQTVAEGVEKWEQVEFLKSVECELVQGYIFDHPLPIDEFEEKYILPELATIH